MMPGPLSGIRIVDLSCALWGPAATTLPADRGAAVIDHHPALGRVRQPRPAARFGETIPAPEPQAPMLRQHNREVLTEIGFSDPGISDLVDQGVLAGGN